MKKLYLIDSILLATLLIFFVYNLKFIDRFILPYYLFAVILYSYLNYVMKNISNISLHNKGNYWTYIGVPFILIGKIYFILLIQISAQNLEDFTFILNIILLLQLLIPSFNIMITSYMTNDNRILYFGVKLLNLNQIIAYDITKQTMAVNVVIGYSKNQKIYYFVFSNENLKRFMHLFKEVKK